MHHIQSRRSTTQQQVWRVMEYEIIDKQHVKNTLIRFGVQDGDEIIVSQYLTMRDPQAQRELLWCLYECMDEWGWMDVNVMGEVMHIHSDDPHKTEYDFGIRFWRKAEESDISYRKPTKRRKNRIDGRSTVAY